MILAAGRGERMRPLTDATPKPLLAAGGKPLIVHTLERLVAAGIGDIVVNHAHLGARIEAVLGDGSAWNARIRYSPEDRALETAGGIAHALPMLGPDPFIVVNGDLHTDYDFSRLCSRPLDQRLAHLVLVPNPAHHASGDFALAAGRVSNTGSVMLTFSGIGLYHPRLFHAIPAGVAAPLGPLLRAAADDGQVSGELYPGSWTDVGTPQRLIELDARLRAGRA